MLYILGANVPVSSVQIHQQYIFWPPEMGLESNIKKGKIHSVHYLWSYSHKCLLIDTIDEQKNNRIKQCEKCEQVSAQTQLIEVEKGRDLYPTQTIFIRRIGNMFAPRFRQWIHVVYKLLFSFQMFFFLFFV